MDLEVYISYLIYWASIVLLSTLLIRKSKKVVEGEERV